MAIHIYLPARRLGKTLDRKSKDAEYPQWLKHAKNALSQADFAKVLHTMQTKGENAAMIMIKQILTKDAISSFSAYYTVGDKVECNGKNDIVSSVSSDRLVLKSGKVITNSNLQTSFSLGRKKFIHTKD